MGINQSLDLAQGPLEEIFNGMLIESEEIFIGDVVYFTPMTETGTWMSCLKLIHEVL